MKPAVTSLLYAVAVLLPSAAGAQPPPLAALSPPAAGGATLAAAPVRATAIPKPAAAPPSCPVPTAPLPAGPLPPRELGDRIDSLTGLTGARIVTDTIREPDRLKGQLRTQVRAMAEERLRAAGLRILSREEAEREPGKPRLEFILTPGDPASGCPFRVFVSLRQEAVLVRDPSVRLLLGAWGEGGISDNGRAEGSELETFAFYVDRLIADWRLANSGEPRRRAGTAVAEKPQLSPGQRLDRALSISVGATFPLKSPEEEQAQQVTASSQERASPNDPSLATTIGLSWPGTGWFGRITIFDELISDSREANDSDFVYSFGYDYYKPGTFSLTYSNYGENRFDPDEGQKVSRLRQGSIRFAYKLELKDRVLAPRFTETTRMLRCQPGITTTPTYLDEESDELRNFRTSLSFGCRYPIWRSFYVGATAILYPQPDQQQAWDPDYTYGFGWASYRPGGLVVEYNNYSGNRWPWREAESGGGFFDGSVTVSYRLPLGGLLDRLWEAVTP